MINVLSAHSLPSKARRCALRVNLALSNPCLVHLSALHVASARIKLRLRKHPVPCALLAVLAIRPNPLPASFAILARTALEARAREPLFARSALLAFIPPYQAKIAAQLVHLDRLTSLHDKLPVRLVLLAISKAHLAVLSAEPARRVDIPVCPMLLLALSAMLVSTSRLLVNPLALAVLLAPISPGHLRVAASCARVVILSRPLVRLHAWPAHLAVLAP